MNEEQKKVKEDESVCDVKSILKTIFETQNKAKLPVFQGVFQETIPFILYSSETIEPFIAYATSPSSHVPFRTCFFCIENLTNTTVHLSLLLPSDVEGSYLETTCMPFRLKKTNSSVIVSLKNFCGIQCVSPKLVNRKVIISGGKC